MASRDRSRARSGKVRPGALIEPYTPSARHVGRERASALGGVVPFVPTFEDPADRILRMRSKLPAPKARVRAANVLERPTAISAEGEAFLRGIVAPVTPALVPFDQLDDCPGTVAGGRRVACPGAMCTVCKGTGVVRAFDRTVE